jgi:hypothetical protein
VPVPTWLWLATVLTVDVAHVHATWFRVYLEPDELRRRPVLYVLLPLLCYTAGVLAHAVSSQLFWRLLAYAAVFHFVRQPYGWVALYRAKAGESGRLDRWLDTAVIYASTLWPLLWWHGHLPRAFTWFVPDDFAGPVPAALADAASPLYAGLLAAFAARQTWRAARGLPVNYGKVLVVAATALTWYVGIVALDSDVAFTVTNVLPHGIPYMVLVWYAGRRNPAPLREGVAAVVWRGGAWLFFALLVGAAFLEEAAWDTTVWHDHPGLFGDGIDAGDWHTFLVPLLALPQLTHYALDGFIWRRRSNPAFARQVAGPMDGV